MRDEFKAVSGYFSLLQACPDRGRGEVANLGVLLFSPDTGLLKVKSAVDGDRLSRFFPQEANLLDRLHIARKAIEERIKVEGNRFKTVQDLEAFARSRVNDIVVTLPRSIRIEDPTKTLEELFDLYVSAPEGRKRRTHRVPLLDEVCERLEREGRDVWGHKRFDMQDLPCQYDCDYGFRNGKTNLIIVRSFSADLAEAVREAKMLSGDGFRAERHVKVEGKGVHVIVASAGLRKGDSSKVETTIRPFFTDFKLEFVPSEQLQELADRIEHETGPLAA